jgi:branched-chain amino acid transport system substrate-binding protein
LEIGRRIKMAKGTFICLFALLIMTSIIIPSANAAEKGPIKIGFIAPLTGPFAQLGTDMVEGFKMFMGEINNSVAGRKIEVIVEDEAGSPDIAVSKVRRLISHDKVNMIAGVFQGSISYAIAPITVKEQVPFINTASAADDLTQRNRSKYLIRVCWTGGQLGHVAGDYAYNKLGWRRAVILGYDYSWGYENAGGFQRVFEELGGKVIQKVWVPVGNMDFGPYLANLKPDADGLFEVVTGAPSIRLVKALRASGLMEKWKVILPGTGVDETLLPALGDDGVGLYSPWTYSVALNNPENLKFVEKRKKSFKKEATSVMAMNYIGADWIVRGIKAVSGDVENREKFMQALQAVEIRNSIQGPLKVDKYGQAVTNIYIRRVDKIGAGYQNTVVETYPMVSQFWKYDPETYLKSPIYTRDYPACKFCE